MKATTLLLTTIIFLGMYPIQAQTTKNYAYCKKQIDSLTAVYSTDKDDESISTYYIFDGAILNTKEKEALLVKIEAMLAQKQYSNLYFYGHALLYNMFLYQAETNTPKIRQKIIELNLQYYFYPGNGFNVTDPYCADIYSDYSQKAKQRIPQVVAEHKTPEEFQAWLKYYTSIYAKNKDYNEASRLMWERKMEPDSTMLTYLRDSIIKSYVMDGAKNKFESIHAERDLVIIVGLLEMKECIPMLKEKLAFNIANDYWEYDIMSYRYALARLGDAEQRQYILDNLMDIEVFNRLDFQYFKDDGMIWRYIEANYIEGKTSPDNSGGKILATLKTMNNIYPFVKGVPKTLQQPSLMNNDNDISIDYKWAKDFYKWLMENKANIKFDYKGEKKWEW